MLQFVNKTDPYTGATQVIKIYAQNTKKNFLHYFCKNQANLLNDLAQ